MQTNEQGHHKNCTLRNKAISQQNGIYMSPHPENHMNSHRFWTELFDLDIDTVLTEETEELCRSSSYRSKSMLVNLATSLSRCFLRQTGMMSSRDDRWLFTKSSTATNVLIE
mmetsp:Transcript_15655/g.24354  ORF Transcript_15655/g.24354 Transcript_15655/m.24354 type:complete len:112 (+) Transcript_15655:171-506(+)